MDESKLCDGLGPGFPLPVEITPFCHEHTIRTIAALPSCAGCDAVLRMGSSSSNKPDGDEIAITDNGNYIVDLHFKEPIKDAPKMAAELKNTVGVVDHGLFCGMTTAGEWNLETCMSELWIFHSSHIHFLYSHHCGIRWYFCQRGMIFKSKCWRRGYQEKCKAILNLSHVSLCWDEVFQCKHHHSIAKT